MIRPLLQPVILSSFGSGGGGGGGGTPSLNFSKASNSQYWMFFI